MLGRSAATQFLREHGLTTPLSFGIYAVLPRGMRSLHMHTQSVLVTATWRCAMRPTSHLSNESPSLTRASRAFSQRIHVPPPPRAFCRWRSMAVAAPLMMMLEGPFPVSELAMSAAIAAESQAVRGTIGTSVSTPIGRLPVKGRVTAVYTCDGAFSGTVGYSFLVRLGAGLKGVGLVTSLDGQLAPTAVSECRLGVESLAGRFRITDSTITGYVQSGEDSMEIGGTLRAFGDTAYHATVTPTHGFAADSATVTFHVR